jgi:hypothetical protein
MLVDGGIRSYHILGCPLLRHTTWNFSLFYALKGILITSYHFTLTSEERAWFDKKHTVRVRVADWPPFLIVKDNEPPQGIVIE